jgi:hypothetical protein
VQTATLIAAGISRFEVTTKKKPFDFFVERLPLKKSRGDRTPIELFLAGVASWEPYIERLLIAA